MSTPVEDIRTSIFALTDVVDVVNLFYAIVEEFVLTLQGKLKLHKIPTQVNIETYYNRFKMARRVNASMPIGRFMGSVYAPFSNYIYTRDVEFFKTVQVDGATADEAVSIMDILNMRTTLEMLPESDIDFIFYYLSILCYIGEQYVVLTHNK